MKVGVISDTHDQIEQIEKAVELLNKEQVELVIHCGDWVAPFTLIPLKKLKAPLKGIFGNNDGERFRHLARSQENNVTYEPEFMKLEIDKRTIAVYHGTSPELVEALVKCNLYDAVFHGHTHVRVNETHEKTLSLNPGTFLKKTMPGVEGASFAIYDTSTNTARFIDL